MDARQHETGNLQKNTYFILIYNTYTLLSIDTAYTVRAKKKKKYHSQQPGATQHQRLNT